MFYIGASTENLRQKTCQEIKFFMAIKEKRNVSKKEQLRFFPIVRDISPQVLTHIIYFLKTYNWYLFSVEKILNGKCVHVTHSQKYVFLFVLGQTISVI